MGNDINNPKETQDKREDQPRYSLADQTPRREGGEDSLAEASPIDPRDDEKVLVNEKKIAKDSNSFSENS